ncbi:MAG: hypothetical protein ACP5I1_11965, partial [Candidatus Hinthialibacter sp.]
PLFSLYGAVLGGKESRAPMTQENLQRQEKTAISRSDSSNLGGLSSPSILIAESFSKFKPFGKELNDEPHAVINDGNLAELSGIAPARGLNEYWGHNDKGNDPEIYRFNLQGEILQKVVLKGAKNNDWEAIERDENGNLIIGAFGDNDEKREEYCLYQFPEPHNKVKKIDRYKIFRFVYSNSQSHNCEAFFLCDRKIYLVTKEKKKKDNPILFCIPRLDENALNVAEEIGRLDISGKVTDAAFSATHQILAIMTSSGIAFYQVQTTDKFFLNPVRFVETDFDQCEGLCLDGDHLVASNESGEIWKYSLDSFLR